MTTVPNAVRMTLMGRWCYGLVAAAAIVGGCAAPSRPSETQQQLPGDDGADLAGVADVSDLAGLGGSNCTDGASCSTGNMGACGTGHIVCSGGAASCVPDATTQACYTGPANTMGVGACKAGVQTCIGTLGSCDGQVLPAAQENCFNDVDDDCDGVVNNGCPTALTTGTPRVLTLYGNAGGGTPFSLRCPANSYLTKIVVYGDSNDLAIAGLDIACATPTLTRGASSYTVTPTAVTPNPATIRGGNITTSANGAYDCGTTGFNPGFYAEGAYDSTGVDELGMSCGVGTLNLGSDNKLAISITQAGSKGVSGYTGLNGEAAFPAQVCNANEVLVGFDGRYGNWFDAISAVCAPLQVTYK